MRALCVCHYCTDSSAGKGVLSWSVYNVPNCGCSGLSGKPEHWHCALGQRMLLCSWGLFLVASVLLVCIPGAERCWERETQQKLVYLSSHSVTRQFLRFKTILCSQWPLSYCAVEPVLPFPASGGQKLLFLFSFPVLNSSTNRNSCR